MNRTAELERLSRAFAGTPSLTVLYGRRRLGKSRLLGEALRRRSHVYFVGAARDAPLSRRALAVELGRALPGFADVEYPEWDALLARLWREAPPKLVVALDEFHELVQRAPELPSLLQKRLDTGQGPHLVIAGSSQRMMQGLVLDASAPLYGRARVVLKLEPMSPAWLKPALRLSSAAAIVEHHAVWGGVPRYWELARDYSSLWEAVSDLVLEPLSVLHREPERLLLDEHTDVVRSASILALVGQGAHRVSEIAARLGLPATALSHSLARLLELGLLERQLPFGRSTRDTKRTAYQIGDPFLGFWYRWVDPNRSRLGAGLLSEVLGEIRKGWPQYLGLHWERLARDAVATVPLLGRRWNPASRWWGPGVDAKPLELDIVATAADGSDRALVAEAKLACAAAETGRILETLAHKAARCPELQGRRVECALLVVRKPGRGGDPRVLDAKALLEHR